ncbi:MAG TPA: acyl-CoA thioesterase domain-containing protein, partial [Jatrophihabitans sp.]
MSDAAASSPSRPPQDGFGIQLGSDLYTLLDLEQIEENIFRGQSLRTRWQRAFGGQVAAQALVAAGRTVPADRQVHSMHSYFLRPGDPEHPIVYDVDRVRDGRSFTTRRVAAIQHGKPIFVLSASFQLDQGGVEHRPEMPSAPAPETLPPLADYHDGVDPLIPPGAVHPAIDLRFVGEPPWMLEREDEDHKHQQVWMRVPTPLSDDPLMHVCA